MSKVVRGVKNITKGYSSVQVKVRNATSNDPWGPTGTDMSEIAALTFNNPSDFYEIMDMLDKRLNDKGKNWRHVLKSLKVLDYCLHEGSELVVTWARKNIYIIKTLREFTYVDEDGRDVGNNVRISAKELTSLILDEDRLRSERSDRKLWKTRVTGIDEYAPQAIAGPAQPNPRQQRRNTRQDEEDAEMRLAIEASKHEADEDARRRAKDKSSAGDNDDDLAKAIKLSKEEESLRARQLEDQNAASLFDDTPTASQPQPTGFNQGYQQQPAVDWFGNPLQQQPQQTGFLNNQYAQPQQTGYQNGYTNGFGQQPTGYDQFGQQPFLQQQNTIQPQQTAFQTNNPYGMQQQPQPSIFDAQPQQQQQQESSVQPGSHNPWATGNQQQQPLQPLPTGSNNPFAQRQQQQSQPPMPQRTQTQPTLSTLYEQQPATQFKPQQPNPIASFQPPPPQQQQQRPQDQQYAKLNALLASGEGQDTFGNVGDLRIPAQHTAPGTFVNSAGAGAQRLTANATGSNPFFSQQFTGAPQLPAQTGLAGGFGGYGQQQSNNPFGGQQRQQGGSLIDL